jgi:hypothetical protein
MPVTFALSRHGHPAGPEEEVFRVREAAPTPPGIRGVPELLPVADRALIVVLIPHPGKTGPELPPATPRTAERQQDWRHENLAGVAEPGTENLTAALNAKRQGRRF